MQLISQGTFPLGILVHVQMTGGVVSWHMVKIYLDLSCSVSLFLSRQLVPAGLPFLCLRPAARVPLIMVANAPTQLCLCQPHEAADVVLAKLVRHLSHPHEEASEGVDAELDVDSLYSRQQQGLEMGEIRSKTPNGGMPPASSLVSLPVSSGNTFTPITTWVNGSQPTTCTREGTPERAYLVALLTVAEVDCRCFVLMLVPGECGSAKE